MAHVHKEKKAPYQLPILANLASKFVSVLFTRRKFKDNRSVMHIICYRQIHK